MDILNKINEEMLPKITTYFQKSQEPNKIFTPLKI